jgi:hypothetical protein
LLLLLLLLSQALWRRHTNTPSSRRHLYEVVQAGCPCHLYFDLEYSTAANPGACGNALVNVLVGLVREEYARLWGIDIRKQVIEKYGVALADMRAV